MKIGIVGRPHVGKTTVFNALGHATAEIGGYTGRSETNRCTINVPDERLIRLAEVLQPKKVTPATIDYIDVAGVTQTDTAQAELDSGILANLRTVDALAHVVRIFEDETVPHVDGSVNPERDIENVGLELTFADLQVIESRLARLRKLIQSQKSPEHETELRVLEQCKQTLEAGTPLRAITLSDNEEKLIRGYGFLTQKPLMLICNIGESQLDTMDEIVKRFSEYERSPGTAVFVLAAQLEMEIAQLDPADAKVFMTEMGLGESALTRFIQASYRLLGLITFFTGNTNEVKAWTLRHGQTAVDAAGTIHTDFERGFVRAEIINCSELVVCGGFGHARSKGQLRVEGKTYQIQEGDTVSILANPTSS